APSAAAIGSTTTATTTAARPGRGRYASCTGQEPTAVALTLLTPPASAPRVAAARLPRPARQRRWPRPPGPASSARPAERGTPDGAWGLRSTLAAGSAPRIGDHGRGQGRRPTRPLPGRGT